MILRFIIVAMLDVFVVSQLWFFGATPLLLGLLVITQQTSLNYYELASGVMLYVLIASTFVPNQAVFVYILSSLFACLSALIILLRLRRSSTSVNRERLALVASTLGFCVTLLSVQYVGQAAWKGAMVQDAVLYGAVSWFLLTVLTILTQFASGKALQPQGERA